MLYLNAVSFGDFVEAPQPFLTVVERKVLVACSTYREICLLIILLSQFLFGLYA
jgi:hypothetical protein